MNIFSIPTFFTSILVFFLGFFPFSKNFKNAITRSFFYLCLSVAAWLFFASIAYNCSLPFYAELFMRLSYIGIAAIPATVFHFITLFLEVEYKKFIPILYAIFLISIFIILDSMLVVNGLYKYSWGYYPKAGPMHFLFLSFFILPTGFCTFLTIMQYFKGTTQPIKKLQIKYLILAFIFLSFASIDFISNYGISFYPFGYIPTTIFVGIITYSIVRYRLLNVTMLIARTTIFIIVYTFVLGIPFILAFGFREEFIRILGEIWWLFPLVSSTVLATIGPFIYLYIDKKAEDKLLREQRSYQNILRNASSGMIRIKNLSKLLKIIVHVVTKTVKITFAEIYLYETDPKQYILHAGRGRKWLDNHVATINDGSPLAYFLAKKREPIVTEEMVMRVRDNPLNLNLSKLVEQLLSLKAALVIPSFVEDKLIGILILGQKRSGKLYSADDLVVFSVLANQAALAIENAQFYEEIKRTHEQLFQAEKLATIGTMADGLSHQINNRFHALSLIAGDSLDVIKTYDASKCDEETKKILESLKEGLQRIESNVLQGGEVVKGLLKYSRPGEAGYESINFQDVLTGAIDMVKYKIKLGEIDLIQNIPQEAPKIHANLVQLQEVFFNLIDNAYDATKERQVTLKEEGYRGRIEISARSNNGNLEIKVEDNGIGIKDLDKKKLFTPFFTTKATSRKGTGLGLYVIEKIVSAHRGTISIDSHYQSGTQFTINLPLFSK